MEKSLLPLGYLCSFLTVSSYHYPACFRFDIRKFYRIEISLRFNSAFFFFFLIDSGVGGEGRERGEKEGGMYDIGLDEKKYLLCKSGTKG